MALRAIERLLVFERSAPVSPQICALDLDAAPLRNSPIRAPGTPRPIALASALVATRDRLAVEEHAQRSRVARIPIQIRHRLAIRLEPHDVHRTANRPAL